MATWEWDVVNDRVFWSDNFWQLIGQKKGSATPGYRTLARHVHPDERSNIRTTYEQAQQTGQRQCLLGFRVIWPNGSVHWLEACAFLELHRSGRVTRVSGVIVESDTRTSHEPSFPRMRDTEPGFVSPTKTMNEMVTELIHEITQPLSAAATYAGGCIERIRTGNVRSADLFSPLHRLVKQLRLVGDIVDRVRSFAAESTPRMRKLDLNKVAREVYGFLPAATDDGIRTRLELSEHLPMVHGDYVQIKQVLINLIQNAMEAAGQSPETRGEVVIRSRLNSGNPSICVVDNGRGVPENLVDRIFEAFFTTKPDGMGLGLANCRTILKKHNGTIWVEPNHGGAQFCFSIPQHNEVGNSRANP